jgi:anti-anti-sigma regulatory factor
MYCLKVNKKGNDPANIILEGNLDSADLIQIELENTILKLNNSKKIVLGFKEVESINTECYVMLRKLKEKYPIVIQGHSLYIASKLKEYNLI